MNALLARVPLRVRCQINLDLSPNAERLRDELRATSMNPPFWRRHVYVFDAAGAPR